MMIANAANRPNSVRVFSMPMAAPDDMSGLLAAIRDGLTASDIAAVFVKTEGNGLDNDWSRPLAARALRAVLGEENSCGAGGQAPDGVEPVIVISGGCEGFITPHMVVVARSAGGLRFGMATSGALQAHDIGRLAQIEATAAALHLACEQARIEPRNVGYAHVVAPWVEASMQVTVPPVACDAHGSKPFSRSASALGAAVALDGLALASAATALAGRDTAAHGSRCAVTAGATGGRVRAMVFANPEEGAVPGPAGATANGQRLSCAALDDPLCVDRAMTLMPHGHRPVAVLLKGDPPAHGRLRGERVVLAQDSDIHAFRHYRAAMSGVLGAVWGSTRLFIGGGAEHQCPPGGALLALISEPELPT